MAKKANHHQRTVRLLNRANLIACKVEYRDAAFTLPSGKTVAGRHHDAFGIADYLAVGFPFNGTIYVQACSVSSVSARWNKAIAARTTLNSETEPWTLRTILNRGNHFWIIGWRSRITQIRRCKRRVHVALWGDGEAECSHCKGRGYTGGRRRWEPRIVAAYFDEGGTIRQRDTTIEAESKKETEAQAQVPGSDRDDCQYRRGGIPGFPAVQGSR